MKDTSIDDLLQLKVWIAPDGGRHYHLLDYCVLKTCDVIPYDAVTLESVVLGKQRTKFGELYRPCFLCGDLNKYGP